LELGIYESVQVLSSELHRELKVRPLIELDYAKPVTDTLLTVDEFFQAARSQPIVFAVGENKKHFAAALLGLGRKRNWFVNEKKLWKTGEYMPAFLKRYPFVFVKSEDGTNYLGFDERCPAFNQEEGQRLFDDRGNPSKYAKTVLGFLQEYEAANERTAAFCAELERLELLESITVQQWMGFPQPLLKGIKRVSERRLQKLPNEEVLSLVEKGYYKVIIAHLISLGHIERIAK
jgi:hypothetical protein